MKRRTLLIVAAMAALGGGCTTGQSETKVFDLTSEPSRAEAGLPDGESQFTYQAKDLKPFPIKVKLPENKELALDAKSVGFDSLRAPDPSTGAPTTMDIYYYAGSLVDGRDHLLGATKQFGMDSAAVNAWFDEASQPQASSTAKTPFMRTKVGYLNLELQGQHRDISGDQQTVVHYIVTWGEP